MKIGTSRHPGLPPQRTARSSRCSGGYALLLTLVMLALTAVTIGTLAQTSGAEALRAREAERDLQTRWAEASCRRVLLPALQTQLESGLDWWRTDGQGAVAPPPASVTVSLDLRGVRIHAKVQDQQALPNLNQLLAANTNGQPQDVQGILARNTLRARMVPMPMDEVFARRVGAAPYVSWGQLYPVVAPGELSGLDLAGLPLRGMVFANHDSDAIGLQDGPNVTLWGDGALNLWTASPEAIHQVLDDPIGADQVAKLLGLRQDHRDLSARQLVQMLNLGPSERAGARLVLTDQSEAYALWLAITPTHEGEPIPEKRTRWSLTVVENNRGHSGGRNRVFRW